MTMTGAETLLPSFSLPTCRPISSMVVILYRARTGHTIALAVLEYPYAPPWYISTDHMLDTSFSVVDHTE